MRSAYQTINLLHAAVTKEGIYCSHMTAPLALNYGYEVLGSGSYGFVVAHPERDDVVLKVCTDVNDGWVSYALFCMLNPNLPNLLQVHAMKRFGTVTIAEIERLQSNAGHPNRRVGRYDALVELVQQHTRNLMVAALGRPTDLHEDNWMLRDDGEVVLTDPYSRVETPIAIEKYMLADGRIDVTVEQYKEPADAGLATSSEVPAVRPKYEDRMLRGRPVVSGRTRFERLQGLVFPVRPARPYKVRTARFKIGSRIGGGSLRFDRAANIARAADALRRYRDATAQCNAVATKGRNIQWPVDLVWHPMEPAIIPSMPPDLVKLDYADIERRALAFYGQGLEAKVPDPVKEAAG